MAHRPADTGRTAEDLGEVQAGHEPRAAPRPRRRLRRLTGRTVLVATASLAAAAVLFAAYLRLASTVPINSDGAANLLQARDMVHGNPLLHGWWLSDVSFYTTELPQYALLSLVLGASAAVIHVAAAMTYTLLVVLAALLARGNATGREAWARMLVAAGIMLAPQPGNGAFVLLSSPNHVGTAVPVLAAWLVLDRAGRRPGMAARPWVPVAVGVLLAWALAADSLVLVIGVVPLVAACAVRACRVLAVLRLPVASAWYELSLAASAVAAVGAVAVAAGLIHAHGGYVVRPLPPGFAPGHLLAQHLRVTAQGLLLLFGADFSGQPLRWATALVLVHLAGVALVLWALMRGVRRFLRDDTDLVVQVLVVGVLLNIAAFALSTVIPGATVRPQVTWAHEMAPVLPFGAVLAGRLLTARLIGPQVRPVMAAVLLGYVISLGHAAAQPARLPANQQLTSWLVSHHFRYGLAGYWDAASVTVASGERVQVLPVQASRGLVAYSRWENKASWYDPRLHTASFLVIDTQSRYPDTARYRQAHATFGKPAQINHVGRYLVLVWHENLLTRTGTVS